METNGPCARLDLNLFTSMEIYQQQYVHVGKNKVGMVFI